MKGEAVFVSYKMTMPMNNVKARAITRQLSISKEFSNYQVCGTFSCEGCVSLQKVYIFAGSCLCVQQGSQVPAHQGGVCQVCHDHGTIHVQEGKGGLGRHWATGPVPEEKDSGKPCSIQFRGTVGFVIQILFVELLLCFILTHFSDLYPRLCHNGIWGHFWDIGVLC